MQVSILGMLYRNHCFSWLTLRQGSYLLLPIPEILFKWIPLNMPADNPQLRRIQNLSSASCSPLLEKITLLSLFVIAHLLCSSRCVACMAWAIHISLSELTKKTDSQDAISPSQARKTFSPVRQCLTIDTIHTKVYTSTLNVWSYCSSQLCSVGLQFRRPKE